MYINRPLSEKNQNGCINVDVVTMVNYLLKRKEGNVVSRLAKLPDSQVFRFKRWLVVKDIVQNYYKECQ